ncbi:MAG: hypothetical protein AAF958_06140 [Planctomycetota bacterium]
MSIPSPAPKFPSTRWSLVARSGGDCADPAVRQSFGELCEAYRPVLLRYLCQRGDGMADAEDHVQGFLADLIARQSLSQVDAGRGRFRAFLFAALDHHVSNRRRHDQAARRGGQHKIQTIASDSAPEAESTSGGDGHDPARLFDQAWAKHVVHQTLDQLHQDYQAEGRGDWFAKLRPTITQTHDELDRDAIAADLGISTTTLRVAIHRLRRKYRERLLAAIRDTVDDPADVDAERISLFEALAPRL